LLYGKRRTANPNPVKLIKTLESVGVIEWIYDPHAWVGLLTLTLLEIVLGIDNIVFLSIVVGKLPEHQRERARKIGLLMAMGMRLLLLLSISWVMSLTTPWFSLFDLSISGRDLILMGGGLFLIAKASSEIHHSLEVQEQQYSTATSFISAIIQITLLDIIFSLDSVITAVGLVEHLSVMMLAVILAVGVMIWAAKPISDFVEKHPSVKMLALSFLILVGFMLLIEGFGVHVPKGYIYFAMAFSLGVETLNLVRRHKLATAKSRT
jgi:predicted tellurium resistance membrane protein TerC